MQALALGEYLKGMELIVSIASLVVAISALGFTAWQTSVQRKHNKISVRPHLFSFSAREKHDKSAELKVLIINNGLGPAFINKFQLFYNGEPCDPDSGIASALGELSKNSSSTILGGDAAMAPNESRVLISVSFPAESEEDIDKVEEKLDQLDLLIEYSSAYEKMKPYDSRKES